MTELKYLENDMIQLIKKRKSRNIKLTEIVETFNEKKVAITTLRKVVGLSKRLKLNYCFENNKCVTLVELRHEVA
ncbi:hypothetical protein [Vagococcus xieshaowenii]|uniref:Uncharacterized protein n=1 Tax=Vagococcus xieshaowenii TaxID=2562451 RepID=A0AAJ5JLT8_9ENTE|nr:hypothetical protein [Vagococcus xieshaowenii]QCA29668.1 hypothetical protein E4Z98_09790 [Vagococcus xieshaowenii]TFZ42943.1 hypothetical protein E4031_01530 [Vagococcus xieshaowenii]